MLDQAGLMVEIQVLAYLVPMTIAIQVGVYFFYMYYATRNAKLKLNRVLLSYGTFTLLMVWGAFLLVLRRVLGLDEDPLGDAMFTTGFVMVCATPIGFLGFITIHDLSRIMHVGRARVLLVLSIIPIIVLVVGGSKSPWFPPSMALTAINALYLIQFQVRMIKIALGRLKRKLTHLFTGEMLALSSLVFAANATFGFMRMLSSEMSFFVAVGLLTSGFLMLFWAANDFPPFYEFDWRFNLSKLYIVDARDYSFLFVHDFDKPGEVAGVDERDVLFSGAISGIEDMVGFVTGASGKSSINKIQQGEFTIFVEHGTTKTVPIVFILLVKRDLESMAAFLRVVREQFEAYFKNVLFQLESIAPGSRGPLGQLFSSFDIIVKHVVA